MRSRRLVLCFIALFATVLTLAAALPPSPGQASSAAQRPPTGYQITFEVWTARNRPGGDTEDQITIQFANDRIEEKAPSPLFGNLVLQEFSFSGRDAKLGSSFTFDRTVNDISFLNARVIRVINHGTDGWAGEFLSISIRYPDGSRRALLNHQSLYPRQGAQREGGIEKFNRITWTSKNYWESDLQRIRVDRSLAK